jgi:hypothetical protein
MLGDGEKDARRGTVVCTHWLKGLCMKDNDCEFLHQVDPERMPECANGLYCLHYGFTAFCPLRHVAEKVFVLFWWCGWLFVLLVV